MFLGVVGNQLFSCHDYVERKQEKEKVLNANIIIIRFRVFYSTSHLNTDLTYYSFISKDLRRGDRTNNINWILVRKMV